MKHLAASRLVRNFGEYCDSALSEPIIITRNGRERLVILNINEFNTLRRAGGISDASRAAKTTELSRGAEANEQPPTSGEGQVAGQEAGLAPATLRRNPR